MTGSQPRLALPPAGTVHLAFSRARGKTVIAKAFAASPARLLMPRNHGQAVWVFLSSLGGGLLNEDQWDVHVDVAPGAFAFVGTQSSTKAYRSPRGCGQRLNAVLAADAALAIVPDPVVCFAGARYRQEIRVALDKGSSLLLFDGYTSGRIARGERWQFGEYSSQTVVTRACGRSIVDATRLDPRHGSLLERMGSYNAFLSLLAVGPRFASVGAELLAANSVHTSDSRIVVASQVGDDAVLVRVAADRFEYGAQALRPSFEAIAAVLGDDPFARKW